MKKQLMISIIALLIVSMLVGCPKREERNFEKIAIGDSREDVEDIFPYEESYMGLLFFSAYKDNDDCVVIMTGGGLKVEGVIAFSSDRKLLYSLGITPIKPTDFSKCYGKNFEELIDELGPFHQDVSTAFLAPAYVTDHAEIIVFYTFGTRLSSTVQRIQSWDIITGEITEIDP